MRLSDLWSLLNKAIDGQRFFDSIKEHVGRYRDALKKRGSSVPIVVQDDARLSIEDRHVENLCDFFLDEEIDQWTVHYIADAMLLSSSVEFKSLRAKDVIEAFADPEISSPLTRERALKLKLKLK